MEVIKAIWDNAHRIAKNIIIVIIQYYVLTILSLNIKDIIIDT